MSPIVVPYQADWPQRFEDIAIKLRRAFEGAALAIDHIGSTSVVGLAAKPIIDVQVTVRQLADVSVSDVESEGFAYAPEIKSDDPPGWDTSDPSAWRKRYFRLSERGIRIAHIHVRERGRRNQRFALLFRDFLRHSNWHRSAYGEFKTRLAVLVGGRSEVSGIGSYLDLKDPVVHLIAERAERWAEDTGWVPP